MLDDYPYLPTPPPGQDILQYWNSVVKNMNMLELKK